MCDLASHYAGSSISHVMVSGFTLHGLSLVSFSLALGPIDIAKKLYFNGVLRN